LLGSLAARAKFVIVVDIFLERARVWLLRRVAIGARAVFVLDWVLTVPHVAKMQKRHHFTSM
jgi:hypothetical protein